MTRTNARLTQNHAGAGRGTCAIASDERLAFVRGRSGFTLIEMLVVVFIIGVLLSMVFPVLSVVRNRAWRARAHQQAVQVAQAWNAYLLDHRRWMFDASQIDRMNPAACNLLNESRTYLEIDPEMAGYGFIDPWGQRILRDNPNAGIATVAPWQIRVALDDGYDGEVTYDGPWGAQPVRRSAIAWSVGPDGESGTEDDITSWPLRRD